MDGSKQPCSLTDLPAPCLLAIMQHCSSDYRSLFAAARAHSTLQTAAAAALSSITLELKPTNMNSRVLRSLSAYLSLHGHHIEQLDIGSKQWCCPKPKPLHFPLKVQLTSLTLQCMPVALCTSQAAGPFTLRGVLAGQTRLKRLSLHSCIISDGGEGLAAALQQLPALEHLDVQKLKDSNRFIALPGGVLPGLQKLTFLQLAGGALYKSAALQDLAALTGLLDLRFDPGDDTVATDVLAPLTGLTSLCLVREEGFEFLKAEAGVLAGKSNLQHLSVAGTIFQGSDGHANGVAAMLSQLQHVQGLTYLDMSRTLLNPAQWMHAFSAEACAAITASTKLQHLDISVTLFIEGSWRHLFNPSRQLPQLRELIMSGITTTIGDGTWPYETDFQLTAADAARMVSCCPGLQVITANSTLQNSTLQDPEAITAFSTLSSLKALQLATAQPGWSAALAQLTRLTRLHILGTMAVEDTLQQTPPFPSSELLLLTQLKRLAWLQVGDDPSRHFRCEGAEDSPVWRQLQQYCNASSS